MLDFQTQAQKFLSITNAIRISSNAQCLYFQLLNFFNQHFWPSSLEIDNMTIYQNTRLSRQQLTNARQELQKLALIKYTNGIGSRAGEYTLIDISKAKLGSVLDISNINDVKIDNITALREQIDCLVGDNLIWGEKILSVLSNAVSNNKSGVYANYYASAQLFLKAEQTIQTNVIYRLIEIMKHKPDIQDRESYILTTITNCVKKQMKQEARV